MPVKVQIDRNETVTHETANRILVTDGHLNVWRGSAEVVAIHAPGQWRRAEVLDSK